jgi:nicotinate phosphoribosyltransferase
MKHTERNIAEGMLYTDQYQLTMAQLYFRMGLHEKRARFEHFFRRYPDYGVHQAGYCINAGLQWLLDWMAEARFTPQDIQLLRSQKGSSGSRVFEDDFLQWLEKNGNFKDITLQAIPEGRVVHPNLPLTVVEGPLAMAQILETALLNLLNYPVLIATKAARVRESAGSQMVMDFGLRRAQERGANAGVRAALIGGADFSSAVGVSHVLGYPPRGTHAHSLVQLFMALGRGELGAFRAYARLYPDDCLLLVDTVNTLESGVPNAIRVFEELRQTGHRPVGIRLDSGDLAYLSIQAGRMLNQAGFSEQAIVLSNQLDELVIQQILHQIEKEATKYGVDPDRHIQRLVFGVGTRMISSAGESALDGVYKMVGVEESGQWLPAIKISESLKKSVNPGRKQVWRIYDQRGTAVADLMTLMEEKPMESSKLHLHHPNEEGVSRQIEKGQISRMEPLLMDVLRDGRIVCSLPSMEEIREHRRADVERLDSGVRRLINPHIYHVSLSEQLWLLKKELIRRHRGE